MESYHVLLKPEFSKESPTVKNGVSITTLSSDHEPLMIFSFRLDDYDTLHEFRTEIIEPFEAFVQKASERKFASFMANSRQHSCNTGCFETMGDVFQMMVIRSGEFTTGHSAYRFLINAELLEKFREMLAEMKLICDGAQTE